MYNGYLLTPGLIGRELLIFNGVEMDIEMNTGRDWYYFALGIFVGLCLSLVL